MSSIMPRANSIPAWQVLAKKANSTNFVILKPICSCQAWKASEKGGIEEVHAQKYLNNISQFWCQIDRELNWNSFDLKTAFKQEVCKYVAACYQGFKWPRRLAGKPSLSSCDDCRLQLYPNERVIGASNNLLSHEGVTQIKHQGLPVH